MSDNEDSWYEIVDQNQGPKQGDFIESCPVIIPEKREESNEVEAIIETYDVVILSQSCDIEQEKLDFVLLCPVWPLGDWEKQYPHFKDDNLKESLNRGHLFGHCMLNKCKLDEYKGKEDFFVVDFRNVYSISLNELKEIIRNNGKRLRLVSPYKEHLSQSFARFFMRVGLPTNIPSFTGK